MTINIQKNPHYMSLGAEKSSADQNHGKQPYISCNKCSIPLFAKQALLPHKSNEGQNNAETACQHRKRGKTKKKRAKRLEFSNHNFQKHTVVTVKKLGEQLTKNIGFSQVQQLAKRIWLIFLSSDINSKKILLILFGKADLKKEACKGLFRQCYLGEMCSSDEMMVQEAQNLLRRSFLTLVDDDLIRLHTKRSRNIYHKEEFIAYFVEFVQQLKNGPFLKSRIDNQTKKRIERRARAQKRLSKVQYKRSKDFVYQQLE